jgi:hypothetical protein
MHYKHCFYYDSIRQIAACPGIFVLYKSWTINDEVVAAAPASGMQSQSQP